MTKINKNHEPWQRKCAEKCGNGTGFHDSFWKTVTESPQWKEWSRHVECNFLTADSMKEWPGEAWHRDNPIFDVDECEVTGIISQKHFQAFLKFCKEK